MRSKAALAVIICLLCCAALARGQEVASRRAPQLVVPLESAGYVAFKTETIVPETENASASTADLQEAVKPQVLVDENHVVHRVLVDNSGALIFGYDLVIEPLAKTRQFRVSVRPLDPEFEKQMRARQPTATARTGRPSLGMSASTVPRPTEAQIIDDGDGFALELLVNPQTGVKIVDVVKASFDQSRLWEGPKQPARDLTLDSVEMAVRDFKLLVNGNRVAGGRPSQGFSGPLIWFFVPDRGRFIFSLTPREGYEFQKIGRIEDNKISFTLEGDYYEWVSSTPIVGSGGNWNVWVLRDTGYAPAVFYLPEAVASSSVPNDVSAGPPDFELKTLKGMPPSYFDPSRNRDDVRARRDQMNARALKARASAEKIPVPPRVRVEVGAADSIQNLWPK